MLENDSLTLIQEKVDEWINNHGGYWPPLSMLASVMEEVGEISRELNHLEGFKPKKPTEKVEDLGYELGDLFFSVICLANYYEINLSEVIEVVLKKYSKRDAYRFK